MSKLLNNYLPLVMTMVELGKVHKSDYGYYGGHMRKPKPQPTNRLSDDEIHKRKVKAKRRRK